MRAAVLHDPRPGRKNRLQLENVPEPPLKRGEALLRVLACAVCRTDLHIIEGELPPHTLPLVPGHQIVGEVIACSDAAPNGATSLKNGMRVGVSWLGSVDGTCEYCGSDRENLCDNPVFTGYDRDGGYAEYVTVRADFCYELPPGLDDAHAAPLLCAGTIGYRTMRVADVQRGERIGLYGFGASAHLVMPVLQSMDCSVYVATRGERHRELARKTGAAWVGEALDAPPEKLDRALTFAPSGDVVIAALRDLRKGGVVAINAIHLDRMPQFDYDSLLWGERQIRSVANMKRSDAREFLELAAAIGLKPEIQRYSLTEVNDALLQLKDDRLPAAAAVIVP